MLGFFSIGLGGFCGAIMRHYLSHVIHQMLGHNFPYGILVVNVMGSLLMGCLAFLLSIHLEVSVELRQFVLVGFLGGFTTFSSFSLDTLVMLQSGHYTKALLYIVLSVLLSLGAISIAWHTTKSWLV